MKRILATILLAGSIGAAAYAATLGSMSTEDGMRGMRVPCVASACAASRAPFAPSDDCAEHCLTQVQVPALPASPAASGFAVAAAVAAAVLTVRIVAAAARPRGAPPHLGPSLRTLALAGVVMRN